MEKELPKGWTKARLGDVAQYINGRTFKSYEWEQEGLPIIRIQNLTNHNKEFNYSLGKYEKRYFIQNGDILFSWSATLGVFIWDRGDAWLNQHIYKVEPNETIVKDFLFYVLKEAIEEMYSKAHGTGMVHINKGIFENTKFLFPPKLEQERIVAKLNFLFAQLEQVKEGLVKIPVILNNLRQAMLTQAVTGKLTEDWRVGKELGDIEIELNNIKSEKQKLIKNRLLRKSKLEPVKNLELIYSIIPKYWATTIFDDIFNFIDYRGKTPQKTDMGVRLITAKNIKMGFLSDEPIEFLASDKYDKWMTRGFPQSGDIFFVTEGHTMGNVAINNRNDKFALAQRTITLQPIGGLNTKFYLYVILLKRYQLLIDNNATGTAAKGIKAAKFKNLAIPFPSIREQQEIVRRVEALFAQADAIEERYTLLKEKIEHLPQAILAKAFRGELVEQLPTDGDARELLDEIKKMKAGLVTGEKMGKV